MTNKNLLSQALDALETNQYAVADAAPHADVMAYNDVITALREALAAPQPEPVAWQFRWTNPGNKPDVRPHEVEWREVVQTNSMHTIEDAVEDLRRYSFDGKPCYEVRPLYAAPPAAPAPVVPLTDEQIIELRVQAKGDYKPWSESIAFARAIEKAHGIGTTGATHE